MNNVIELVFAVLAFSVSCLSFALSIYTWKKSFRPIVTAAIRTRSAGNTATAFDLVLLNSGAIPAKEIVIRVDEASLVSSLGKDATFENKRRWLSCFVMKPAVELLQNGDSVSCAFGTIKADDEGFWISGSSIDVVIQYSGWSPFERRRIWFRQRSAEYTEKQRLRLVDSDSFTGFLWSKK